MFKKIISAVIIFTLVFEQSGFAQVAPQMGVPAYLSGLISPDKFRPVHLRSLSFDAASNEFDLVLEKGDAKVLKEAEVKASAGKLMEYFQIGLRLPNSMFWVNLRPDAPAQIIDPYLERTDIGKAMLEADLQLKKDLARFTSPDAKEGRQYWNKLYARAEQLFGQQDISIPTVTRPWIVPSEIIIREQNDGAYVYKATMKVMLEQDYLKDAQGYQFDDPRLKQINEYSSQLVRELIIPKLTRDVNSSKRYAPLRQVFYSLVLAQWFKERYAKKAKAGADAGAAGIAGTAGTAGAASLLGTIDSRDLSGLASRNAWSKEAYFKQYQRSFQQGEYDKEETVSGPSGLTVRRYFSGGIVLPIATEGIRVLSDSAHKASQAIMNIIQAPAGAAELPGGFKAHYNYNGGVITEIKAIPPRIIVPQASVVPAPAARSAAASFDGGVNDESLRESAIKSAVLDHNRDLFLKAQDHVYDYIRVIYAFTELLKIDLDPVKERDIVQAVEKIYAKPYTLAQKLRNLSLLMGAAESRWFDLKVKLQAANVLKKHYAQQKSSEEVKLFLDDNFAKLAEQFNLTSVRSFWRKFLDFTVVFDTSMLNCAGLLLDLYGLEYLEQRKETFNQAAYDYITKADRRRAQDGNLASKAAGTKDGGYTREQIDREITKIDRLLSLESAGFMVTMAGLVSELSVLFVFFGLWGMASLIPMSLLIHLTYVNFGDWQIELKSRRLNWEKEYANSEPVQQLTQEPSNNLDGGKSGKTLVSTIGGIVTALTVTSALSLVCFALINPSTKPDIIHFIEWAGMSAAVGILAGIYVHDKIEQYYSARVKKDGISSGRDGGSGQTKDGGTDEYTNWKAVGIMTAGSLATAAAAYFITAAWLPSHIIIHIIAAFEGILPGAFLGSELSKKFYYPELYSSQRTIRFLKYGTIIGASGLLAAFVSYRLADALFQEPIINLLALLVGINLPIYLGERIVKAYENKNIDKLQKDGGQHENAPKPSVLKSFGIIGLSVAVTVGPAFGAISIMSLPAFFYGIAIFLGVPLGIVIGFELVKKRYYPEKYSPEGNMRMLKSIGIVLPIVIGIAFGSGYLTYSLIPNFAISVIVMSLAIFPATFIAAGAIKRSVYPDLDQPNPAQPDSQDQEPKKDGGQSLMAADEFSKKFQSPEWKNMVRERFVKAERTEKLLTRIELSAVSVFVAGIILGLAAMPQFITPIWIWLTLMVFAVVFPVQQYLTRKQNEYQALPPELAKWIAQRAGTPERPIFSKKELNDTIGDLPKDKQRTILDLVKQYFESLQNDLQTYYFRNNFGRYEQSIVSSSFQISYYDFYGKHPVLTYADPTTEMESLTIRLRNDQFRDDLFKGVKSDNNMRAWALPVLAAVTAISAGAAVYLILQDMIFGSVLGGMAVASGLFTILNMKGIRLFLFNQSEFLLSSMQQNYSLDAKVVETEFFTAFKEALDSGYWRKFGGDKAQTMMEKEYSDLYQRYAPSDNLQQLAEPVNKDGGRGYVDLGVLDVIAKSDALSEQFVRMRRGRNNEAAVQGKYSDVLESERAFLRNIATRAVDDFGKYKILPTSLESLALVISDKAAHKFVPDLLDFMNDIEKVGLNIEDLHAFGESKSVFNRFFKSQFKASVKPEILSAERARFRELIYRMAKSDTKGLTSILFAVKSTREYMILIKAQRYMNGLRQLVSKSRAIDVWARQPEAVNDFLRSYYKDSAVAELLNSFLLTKRIWLKTLLQKSRGLSADPVIGMIREATEEDLDFMIAARKHLMKAGRKSQNDGGTITADTINKLIGDLLWKGAEDKELRVQNMIDIKKNIAKIRKELKDVKSIAGQEETIEQLFYLMNAINVYQVKSQIIKMWDFRAAEIRVHPMMLHALFMTVAKLFVKDIDKIDLTVFEDEILDVNHKLGLKDGQFKSIEYFLLIHAAKFKSPKMMRETLELLFQLKTGAAYFSRMTIKFGFNQVPMLPIVIEKIDGAREAVIPELFKYLKNSPDAPILPDPILVFLELQGGINYALDRLDELPVWLQDAILRQYRDRALKLLKRDLLPYDTSNDSYVRGHSGSTETKDGGYMDQGVSWLEHLQQLVLNFQIRFIPEAVLNECIEKLKDKQLRPSDETEHVAGILGMLNNKRAVDALEEYWAKVVLADDKWENFEKAPIALTNLGYNDEMFEDLLIAIFIDERNKTLARSNAIKILGRRYGTKRALELFKEYVKTKRKTKEGLSLISVAEEAIEDIEARNSARIAESPKMDGGNIEEAWNDLLNGLDTVYEKEIVDTGNEETFRKLVEGNSELTDDGYLFWDIEDTISRLKNIKSNQINGKTVLIVGILAMNAARALISGYKSEPVQARNAYLAGIYKEALKFFNITGQLSFQAAALEKIYNEIESLDNKSAEEVIRRLAKKMEADGFSIDPNAVAIYADGEKDGDKSELDLGVLEAIGTSDVLSEWFVKYRINQSPSKKLYKGNLRVGLEIERPVLFKLTESAKASSKELKTSVIPYDDLKKLVDNAPERFVDDLQAFLSMIKTVGLNLKDLRTLGNSEVAFNFIFTTRLMHLDLFKDATIEAEYRRLTDFLGRVPENKKKSLVRILSAVNSHEEFATILRMQAYANRLRQLFANASAMDTWMNNSDDVDKFLMEHFIGSSETAHAKDFIAGHHERLLFLLKALKGRKGNKISRMFDAVETYDDIELITGAFEYVKSNSPKALMDGGSLDEAFDSYVQNLDIAYNKEISGPGAEQAYEQSVKASPIAGSNEGAAFRNVSDIITDLKAVRSNSSIESTVSLAGRLAENVIFALGAGNNAGSEQRWNAYLIKILRETLTFLNEVGNNHIWVAALNSELTLFEVSEHIESLDPALQNTVLDMWMKFEAGGLSKDMITATIIAKARQQAALESGIVLSQRKGAEGTKNKDVGIVEEDSVVEYARFDDLGRYLRAQDYQIRVSAISELWGMSSPLAMSRLMNELESMVGQQNMGKVDVLVAAKIAWVVNEIAMHASYKEKIEVLDSFKRVLDMKPAVAVKVNVIHGLYDLNIADATEVLKDLYADPKQSSIVKSLIRNKFDRSLIAESFDGGQFRVVYLDKGERVADLSIPADAMPDALNTYRYFGIDMHIIKAVGEDKIGNILQQILDNGFKPITAEEQTIIREERGAADWLEIFPAFNENNTIDPGHVIVTTMRIKADKSIKYFAYKIKISPGLDFGDTTYDDVYSGNMRSSIDDGLGQAQNQDGGQTLELDITATKDGGDATYGGVDFRALPVVTQPAAAPGLINALAPNAVSLSELDSQWKKIQAKIHSGPMPYDDIKKYVVACRGCKEAAQELNDAAACIAGILAMEEDAAVTTSPEMKEILALI